MPNQKFLSVLVPTFNEASNIKDLIQRTAKALEGVGIDYEILIIDDASVDNTAEIAQKALKGRGEVICRQAKNRSLSHSVLDGISRANGNIISVIDADCSHPPELIPSLFNALNDQIDLAIASRYVAGGGTEGFPFKRRLASRFACLISSIVTDVKDNTSGFFMIKKEVLEGVELTPLGFKIGLEIFVKANIKGFKEIPYIFADRKKGRSKLKILHVAQFFHHIILLLKYKRYKRTE